MEDREINATELDEIIKEHSRQWKGIEVLHDNGKGMLFRETAPNMDPLAPRGPEGTTGTAVSVTTSGNVVTIDLYAVRRYR